MTQEKAMREAKQILANDNQDFQMRSCWNCNGAHEHLKNAAYVFVCFECGHWFYKGHDVTEQEAADARP